MKTHRYNPRNHNLYGEKMSYCGITGFLTTGERTPVGRWKTFRRQTKPVIWQDEPDCKRCLAAIHNEENWRKPANKMDK